MQFNAHFSARGCHLDRLMINWRLWPAHALQNPPFSIYHSHTFEQTHIYIQKQETLFRPARVIRTVRFQLGLGTAEEGRARQSLALSQLKKCENWSKIG